MPAGSLRKVNMKSIKVSKICKIENPRSGALTTSDFAGTLG